MLCPCPHFTQLTADEVVHGLLLGQLADGRQHAKRVAAQHDDILGVAAHAGDFGVLDELDGVGGASVLGDGAAWGPRQQGGCIREGSIPRQRESV